MERNPHVTVFADGDALAAALADRVATALSAALETKERVSLAVSGGSSPLQVHGLLAERPLAWDRVDVVLVDERWVAPDHEGSNEAFVRETLLHDCAQDAQLTGLWSETGNLPAGATIASRAMAYVSQPLDVVLLGMGPDGHTASWFPSAEGLTAALADDASPVVAIRAQASDVTGALTERLTLSLPMVAEATSISLLMRGETKRAVFEQALSDGDVEDLPVRAILRKRPDMWVGWAP
ncbi:MAG: 6-phosphogluconolactonase [Pseudomonadota bacterium]